MSAEPIRLTDIESKLRQLDDDVRGKVASKRNTIIVGAVATAIVVLLVAYLFGKRSGRKKSTFVEIRRL
jgi:uncharacterized membrane protein YvbJ